VVSRERGRPAAERDERRNPAILGAALTQALRKSAYKKEGNHDDTHNDHHGTPPRAAAGHDNELDVLVRVQAPDAPAEQPQRNPLHLALVIDRSGSMSGQPLDEAKRCAEFVLDGLQATDRLSVVVYDDHVQTLVPTTTLHDKEFARRAIRGIDSGGSTDLHGGWFQGAETLARTRRRTSRRA